MTEVETIEKLLRELEHEMRELERCGYRFPALYKAVRYLLARRMPT